MLFVAESLSQAAAEKDEASHRGDVLEKRLKDVQDALDQAKAEARERGERLGALEKKSQDALDQAKIEARKREEKLEGRLRTLVEELSGKTLCHGFLHVFP